MATTGNALMDATLELARVGGTVGEWTQSLERVSSGRFTPPIFETSSSVGALRVPVAPHKIRIALGEPVSTGISTQ